MLLFENHVLGLCTQKPLYAGFNIDTKCTHKMEMKAALTATTDNDSMSNIHNNYLSSLWNINVLAVCIPTKH